MTASPEPGAQCLAYTRRLQIYRGIVVLLALAYLVQVITPLRLHADSIILLSLAETAAHGGGFLYHGRPTVYPPGYPALVSILFRIGLPRVWALIGFNAVGLSVGFWAIRYILARRFSYGVFSILNIYILTLLSFVFVKFFAIPLTDICFFGIAMCGLAVMESVSEIEFSRFLWRMLAGWVLVAVALSVRRVGVALIPPLIGTMISRPEFRAFVTRSSIRTRVAVIACAVCLSALTIWIIARTSTLRDFHYVMTGQRWTDAAYQIAGFRLRELGEITVNVPFVLPPGLVSTMPFIGIIVVTLIAAGIFAKRGLLGPTGVFVVSYVVVLLFWPFYDPRFWLPVIPLLFAYAGLALRRCLRHPFVSFAGRAYLVLYTALGVLTVASSTVVTFSGQNFPNVYHDEPYQSTYCAVFRSCTGTPAQTPVNEAALHVYRTYK